MENHDWRNTHCVCLGDLIAFLEEIDKNMTCLHGFGEPMSYRGDYSQLAFEPCEETTFGEMLAHAKKALGQPFEGYKGGTYTMRANSAVWIAKYGEGGGDRIGPTMLRLWKMQTQQADWK